MVVTCIWVEGMGSTELTLLRSVYHLSLSLSLSLSPSPPLQAVIKQEAKEGCQSTARW